MSESDYNPDTCRNIFYGIMDEIASSVRSIDSNISEDYKFSDEMKALCEQNVSEILKSGIDTIWERHNVSRKLEDIKKLQNGQKLIAKQMLQEWKDHLNQQINAVKAETAKELAEIRDITEKMEMSKEL